jgi:hypothetical protein
MHRSPSVANGFDAGFLLLRSFLKLGFGFGAQKTSFNKRFTLRRSSGSASVKHQSALRAFVEFYYSTFLCGRSFASLVYAQKRRKPSTLVEINS